MRNYLFACVESEARLALLAQGCDATMGVLHADQRNRDSLALDAMEPVRADVDAFLFDLLEGRVFTARDFGELPNSICRIAAPLTSSDSPCRIGANPCGLSRRTSRNDSASRSQRGARSRGQASPLCSQHLASARSRDRAQRGNGARQPWKRGRVRRSHARYAASRCSSAGAGIAMRACRRFGASTASVQWKRLARHSQRKPPQATIRGAARP
jgi:hypothetical protein